MQSNRTILKYMLSLVFLIWTFASFGQKKDLEIDTIKTIGDTTYAKLILFRDGILIEESMVILFPDSFIVPRFFLTGNLWKKTIYISRITRHGLTSEYTASGKKSTIKYSYGISNDTIYVEKDNKVISAWEYHKEINKRGPCGQITGEYIIHGQKKNHIINRKGQ